ncbi:MAG: Outer membrane protein assembly factor BamD [Elusimicrobia bacterium]|nr:Outer membrane protein assembly factor BamD [Elusimicrobiota bacterium]
MIEKSSPLKIELPADFSSTFRQVSFFVVTLISIAVPCGAEVSEFEAIVESYQKSEFDQTQLRILESLSNPSFDLYKTPLLLLLASSYLEMGEVDQAEVLLNGLRGMTPPLNSSEAFNLLEARSEERGGNSDKALLSLQKINSDRSVFKSACLLETQGQSYAAILKYQQLLESFPNSRLTAPSRLGLARSYLTLREFDHARRQLEGVSDLPADLKALQSYLSGSLAFQTDNFKEARRFFSMIDDRAPPALFAASRLLDGLSALRDGNESDGQQILTSLLTSKETDAAFQASFELVKHYLITSRPESAVSVCNTLLPALSRDPRKSEILLLRGISYERADQTDQAVKDFQEVMQVGKKETVAKAFVLTASALWTNRQFDRLTTEFSADLKTHRQNQKANAASQGPRALEFEVCDLLVGEAHLKGRRYAEAEKIFEELLLKPLSPHLSSKATGGLVAALVAQQKYGEAEKRLDELMVRFGDDRAVVKFGLLAQAHLFWNKGSYAEAASSYTKYAEMFPDDEDAPLAFYMTGRCQEKTADLTAFTTWDELSKRYPTSAYAPRALVRSASFAERLGDKNRSAVYYQKMARTGESPMVEVALLQIGLNRLKSNQDEESIRTLNQFMDRYPYSIHSAEAVQGITEAYQQIAYVEPQQLPKLAVQFASSPTTGEAYYWMGVKEKDPAKALIHFQKVLKDYPRTPSFARALFYKGQAELDLKDYRQALVSLGEFTKSSRDPDLKVIAQFQRAGALMKAGFPDEACLAYERVAKDAPTSTYASESYLRWAQILETKGDYEGQARVYELFLREFPNNKKANEVYWRLGHIKRRAGAYQVAMNYYRKVVPSEGAITAQDLESAIKSLEKISESQARP